MDKPILIIDDLLPRSYSDSIESDVRNVLQYFYSEKTVLDSNPLVTDTVYDNGHFCCPILHDQGKVAFEWYFPNIKPIFFSVQERTGIEVDGFIRVKANLLLKETEQPQGFYNIPHVDTNLEDYYSMVYYVNDSDGDTFLFDQFLGETSLTIKQRVQPKKNRAIIFNSNRYHASSNPQIHKDRFVLNFIFKVK